jgi:hypothetical protein
MVFCSRCGGSFIEVGVSGGREIPHSDSCPRNPWTTAKLEREQQDAEAAALRRLAAPFPVPDYEPTHPIDCGCGCEDWNRGMK